MSLDMRAAGVGFLLLATARAFVVKGEASVRRGVVRDMGLRSFVKRKVLRRPPIPPEGLSTLEESTLWASDELAAIGGAEDEEAPIPPEGMRALDGEVVWAAEGGGSGGSGGSGGDSKTSGATDRTAAELYDRFEAEQTRLNDWPDDRQCQRRCADDLCAYMRLSTEGQTVTIDGPNDPPAFRAVWRTNAPPALDLYRDLMRDRRYMDLLTEASRAELLCGFIECQSSASSAKGVALAAISGDAARFLSSVKRLQSEHPDHNAGLGWIFECAFFLAAPFPVRSPIKALAAAEKALASKNNGGDDDESADVVDEGGSLSRRNLYYAGLSCLELYRETLKGKPQRPEQAEVWRRQAEIYLSAAREPSATCCSQSEQDISTVVLRECGRALAVVATTTDAPTATTTEASGGGGDDDGKTANWKTIVVTEDEAAAIIEEAETEDI